MKYPWIITFEGSSDCTGKTSLINAFNKKTNFSALLRDRGTLSVRAYAKKFYRDIPDMEDIETHIDSYPFHLLVYLTANKKDVVKRQNEKNDGWNPEDYDTDKKLFDNALKTSRYSKVLRLNSSNMTINEEVEMILEDISRYEKQYDKDNNVKQELGFGGKNE